MPYTLNTTEPGNRWTDSFLNELSHRSDALADGYFHRMVDANFGGKIITPDNPESVKLFAQLFRMDQNNIDQFGEIFQPLKQFFVKTSTLPPGTDLDRCQRGAEVFERTLTVTALILLAKGLPEGYAAPRLTEVLDLSQALVRHPYKRLLATLEMLLQVGKSFDGKQNTAAGDNRGKNAIAIAQKLRLWHAGVREFATECVPDFQWGTRVSMFDMVATIMGFSYLVIHGWETLNVHDVSEQDKEDYYYLWKVFALQMGCYPEGRPGDTSYIPSDVADARLFYARYAEVSYEQNAKGVTMAHASLNMLMGLMPWWLKIFGAGRLPRVYMSILMSEEFCQAKLGMSWLRRDMLLNFLLRNAHVVAGKFENLRMGDGTRLSSRIFRTLIKDKYGAEPVLLVPGNLNQALQTFEKQRLARVQRQTPAVTPSTTTPSATSPAMSASSAGIPPTGILATGIPAAGIPTVGVSSATPPTILAAPAISSEK